MSTLKCGISIDEGYNREDRKVSSKFRRLYA
jgi:hypothetical protein